MSKHRFKIHRESGNVSFDTYIFRKDTVKEFIKKYKETMKNGTEIIFHTIGAWKIALDSPAFDRMIIGCHTFPIEEIEAFIEDYEQNIFMVEAGDRVEINNYECIVAQISATQMALITLTGNRYNEPVSGNCMDDLQPLSKFLKNPIEEYVIKKL